jgi:hypothetical protein
MGATVQNLVARHVYTPRITLVSFKAFKASVAQVLRVLDGCSKSVTLAMETTHSSKTSEQTYDCKWCKYPEYHNLICITP